MDAPPRYPPPPMYTPSRPTSPADDVLPDYDSPASLEPWLAPLRHHNWPALAPLALFVDPAPAEAWTDTRARLVRALLARGLPLDGEHGLNSDWRAGAVPEAVCAAIRTEMPPELRRAAFARVVGHEPRASERPALNPLLLSALEHLGPSMYEYEHTYDLPALQRAILDLLPAPLAHALRTAPIPTPDVARLLHALFVVFCRARWAARAAAAVAAHDAAPAVVRRLHQKWKAGPCALATGRPVTVL